MLGMRLRKVLIPAGFSSAVERIAPTPSRESASIDWAAAGSTPAPGLKRLVTARAMTTATAEMPTVKKSVLRPIRFSALTSPISAIPMTSAEKSKGITSMKSRRRKICPTGPVT